MTFGAFQNRKLPIMRDGEQWRPMVHVQDTARAMLFMIENKNELINGEIFNVGSNDENYTKKHLADIIKQHVTGTEIEILKSKTDPRNYQVSFDKIKKILDFKPKNTVEDSILEILDACKNDNLDPQDTEFSNISKLTEKISPVNNYQFDENL